MYKLIIADDEEKIRKGLSNIIDWGLLGFHVVDTFEDGKDVIDYLSKNSADVILSDIKMNIKSGLDVAEFIYKHKLPTKVILISGYKELDFAMSAIKYNVEEYVLKPIDIDILTESLIKVKSALDKEAEIHYNNLALESIEKSKSEIKDSFFAELMMGSLKNENYINSMFNFIFPNLKVEQCTCFMAAIKINDYRNFIENRWTRTNSDLYVCLKNIVNMGSSGVEYNMISKNYDHLQLLGILTSQEYSPEQANIIIESSNKKLCKELKEYFSTEFTVSELEVFSNIGALLQYNSGNRNDNTINDSLTTKINELQKMIYSTIFTGNIEAVNNVINQYIDNIRNFDLDTIHSIVKDLLIVITNKLQESKMDFSGSILIKDGREKPLEMKTPDEIYACLNLIFTDLVNYIQETGDNEFNIIEQSKKYITENITKDISLEDIAEKFFMSQYYFSRTFKLKSGENFIDFVVRTKMEYAITLLKMPQYKIYEICNIIGYKSERYFTKIFKKYTGYAPSSYRKLLCPEAFLSNDN